MFACIHVWKLPADLSLTEFAYGFSPIVEEVKAGTVVIDVDGCELLFGSAYQLANEVARRAQKSRAEGGRFHFIGSVEPFPREMWMLTRYGDPADLDKDGNLDQVQVSRSNKISDSSRYSRRCRERASCACGSTGECFPHRQGSVFDREDLHTPRTCPACRTQRFDHAGEVEHPFAAIAAPVHRVFEQRPDDL